MTQGFCGFLLGLGSAGCCDEGAVSVADGGPRFRTRIKIFNAIENNRTLSFCRKSLL